MLTLLKTAFPNTKADVNPEQTFALWYSLFGKEEFAIAKKATEIVITSGGDFFPSVNQFGNAIERAKLIMSPQATMITATNKSENDKAKELVQWVLDTMWPKE